MERGLYIAASGMLAEGVRQDLIAHDLANASTPGYKPDRVAERSFGALLLTDQSSGRTVGTLGLGTQIDKQATDFSPGPIRDTGEPLDFAVQGEGFFSVQTAAGVRYTRDGQFQATTAGTLVTPQGDTVLGRGGRPVKVGSDGKVDPNALAVVGLSNPKRQGDTLLTGQPVTAAATGTVRAGALESSGVSPVTTMTAMISSLRAFEAGQRVISTIDSTLGKAANQVGAVS